MSKKFQFECDSCHHLAEAKYNGEHYLPPKGWVEMTEVQSMGQVGHLCDICSCASLNHSLRDTFRKWFKRHFKGTDSEIV